MYGQEGRALCPSTLLHSTVLQPLCAVRRFYGGLKARGNCSHEGFLVTPASSRSRPRPAVRFQKHVEFWTVWRIQHPSSDTRGTNLRLQSLHVTSLLSIYCSWLRPAPSSISLNSWAMIRESQAKSKMMDMTAKAKVISDSTLHKLGAFAVGEQTIFQLSTQSRQGTLDQPSARYSQMGNTPALSPPSVW